MEELIQNFHNLGGTKISEHKKNFNAYKLKLLNSGICLTTFFTKINPITRQEEIFKIKLLQACNMHERLYEIIKSGDKINSNVIFKQLNFLIIFDNVNGVDFVENHCTQLSFVNRVKIINRLALRINDYFIGKDYFENVKSKYGLKIATPLLYACDEKYVQEILIKYDLKLNQTMIIRLYKKYPNFLHFYYVLNKNSEFEEHTKVGRYVANHDLPTYYTLLPYGSPTLGKRTLKKFLLKYKSEANKYPKIFTKKNKVVLRNLSKDNLLVYLQNKLPKSVETFTADAELLRCLQILPKPQRGKLLFICFKRKYGFDLFEEPNLINSYLLQLFSHEDRCCFDLTKFPEMLPISESLPKLQEMFLSNKNPTKKTELGNKLLKTCDVNGDMTALMQVLKLFQQYFNPISKECLENLARMNLEKCSDEHWEYINELRLNFEMNNKDVWWYEDLLPKIILYQILNGKPCSDKDIKTNFSRASNYVNQKSCLEKHPRQYKEFLIRVCEALPRIFEGAELLDAMYNLIHYITTFNKQNPKLTIHYTVYLAHLKTILEAVRQDTKYIHYLFFVSALLLSKNSYLTQQEDVLDDIAKVAHKAYADGVYLWFLKHRPDLLEKYSDLFFNSENMPANTYYELSKMDFSNIYKILKEEALKRLNDGKCGQDVICSIKFLSHVKNVDLQDLVLKYLPDPECEIDPTNPDTVELLNVQRAIISTIKNASPPANNLNRIVYFCKRDYLKYALQPLYYTISYSPEHSIQETLQELLSRAVSVRKHTMHLVTVVGTTALKLEVLKNFAQNETNESLKCFLFKKLLWCFLEERDECWFELLKQNVSLMDNDDWELMELVCRFNYIPKEFYSEYVEMIWNELERGTIDPYRILESACGKIQPHVSERIIKNSLFKKKTHYTELTYKFTANYFLNNKNANFNCVKPQEVTSLAEKVKLMPLISKFLEYTCGYVVEITFETVERKLYVLNKLEELFGDNESKLLIDLTKLFLINGRFIYGDEFDNVMYGINQEFIESLNENIPAGSTKKEFKYKVESRINKKHHSESKECYKRTNSDDHYKASKIKRSAKDKKSTSDEEMMDIDYDKNIFPTQTININFVKAIKSFLLLQKDLNMNIYGDNIIPIIGELSQRYLEKFFGIIYGDTFQAFLILIEQLLDEKDINLAVLCIFLLPKNKTNIARFKIHRRNVIKKINEIASDIVKIYMDWFLGTCGKSVI